MKISDNVAEGMLNLRI